MHGPMHGPTHDGYNFGHWSLKYSLLPTMFSILPRENFDVWVTFILSSAKALNLSKSEILTFGKGITQLFKLSEKVNVSQILESYKLIELADDNFRFNENGEKFYKRIDNTKGKGEIAHSEQFLLFPQCSRKTCCAET